MPSDFFGLDPASFNLTLKLLLKKPTEDKNANRVGWRNGKETQGFPGV